MAEEPEAEEQAVETSVEEELPPLDSFPQLGFCSVCYKPQYKTPHGGTCGEHGGAPTIDEIPKCGSCKANLKPDAKFCEECGESTEPKEEPKEPQAPQCPNCKAEVTGKFCGECGTKMGEAKEEPPTEDLGGMPRDMAEEQMRDEGATEEEIEKTLGPAPESSKSSKKVKTPAKKEEKSEKKVKVPVKTEEEKSEKKVKVPVKKDDGAKEAKKTVKVPSKDEEEEEEESKAEEDFDFSEINPETDWECFGMIEPDHTECKSCPFSEPCAKKSEES